MFACFLFLSHDAGTRIRSSEGFASFMCNVFSVTTMKKILEVFLCKNQKNATDILLIADYGRFQIIVIITEGIINFFTLLCHHYTFSS